MATVHNISLRALKQAAGGSGPRKVKLPKAQSRSKGSPKDFKATLSRRIKKEESGASKVKIEKTEKPTIKEEITGIREIKKEKADVPEIKKEKNEIPIPAKYCVIGSQFWKEAVAKKFNISLDTVSKVDEKDPAALTKIFGRVCPCGKTWKSHFSSVNSEFKKA
jgi:hypothetical protein